MSGTNDMKPNCDRQEILQIVIAGSVDNGCGTIRNASGGADASSNVHVGAFLHFPPDSPFGTQRALAISHDIPTIAETKLSTPIKLSRVLEVEGRNM